MDVAEEFGRAFESGRFPDTADGRKHEAQLFSQMWITGRPRGFFVVHSSIGMSAGSEPWVGEFRMTDEWRGKLERGVLPMARRLEAAVIAAGLEFRVVEGVDV